MLAKIDVSIAVAARVSECSFKYEHDSDPTPINRAINIARQLHKQSNLSRSEFIVHLVCVPPLQSPVSGPHPAIS
jgi:hypothetical protein